MGVRIATSAIGAVKIWYKRQFKIDQKPRYPNRNYRVL